MRAAAMLLLTLTAACPADEVRDEFERQLAVIVKARQASARPSYGEVRARAVAESRPFVVGVGCEPPKGDWLEIRVEELEGFGAPCVALAMPRRGELWHAGTLDEGASASAVRAAIDAYNDARLRQIEAGAAAIEAELRREPVKPKPLKKWNPYDVKVKARLN